MQQFRTMIIPILLLFIVGCASANLPEDQQAAYRGEGTITTLVLNDEGHQEIGLINREGEHFTVVLKEPQELFPGQEVTVNRRAGGFGTVTQ